MNRIFRTLWSHTLQAWVVTSELAKSCGKRDGGRAVGVLLLTPLGVMAADLPSGGTVVSGSGHLSSTGQQLTVEQSSANLAIDWQSFDIGAGHSVTFHQPSSQAVALNRVVGQDASRILGNLDANGRVFLVNPNGILFGQGASVNVGGLVASTLDISNSDFEQGRYHFKSQSTPKAVINQGSLQAHDGGAVALLGGQVSNQGVIVASGGSVALAAGQAMTLDFAGDGLLSVKVDEATADALAENRELIRANGGQVLLTAHASDALLKTVVNNSGVIEAQTLAERGGKIELLGDFDGGTVQVAGTLDASAPGKGNGGFIETSGAHVKVADGAKITTKATQGKSGTWLLDPTDFTVSAGSSALSASGIGASTLAANLQNGNVTLQTVSSGSDTGKLSVNAAVNWSANTSLTLNAHGDLYLNAPLTATGTSAGLVLNYGGFIQNGSATAGRGYYINAPVTLSGSTASLRINGQVYGLLHSLADIQAINTTGLGGSYALAQDLDAAGTTYTSALVGSYAAPFSGTFAGLGHTLANLTMAPSRVINPAPSAPVGGNTGLFGNVSGNVRDLSLSNVWIEGNNGVGGLASINSGTLSNVQVSGRILAYYDSAGGLVYDNQGTIRNASSAASIRINDFSNLNSSWMAGGLVARNSGTLDNTNSSSSVQGAGPTSGTGSLGGLAGINTATGNIVNSYATGIAASGTASTGGLVGTNSGSISYSYSTATADSTSAVGGLVGSNLGTLANVYASGRITGRYAGGLVGFNYGSMQNAYWDVDSTSQSAAINQGATNVSSINSNNRYTASSYANLANSFAAASNGSGIQVGRDSSGVARWIILNGNTRPFLASEYSTQVGNLHQLQLMAFDPTANYSLIRNIDASATASGGGSSLWSSQGFVPLGRMDQNGNGGFSGTFDGLGHTLGNLYIQAPSSDNIGLFAIITGHVHDLNLSSLQVTGNDYTGGLAGQNLGVVNNIQVAGSVSGNTQVGGLVGYNNDETSRNMSSSAGVSGSGNYNSSISNAYATGTVSGANSVGGLVGYNYNASISNAYATSAVSGTNTVGGLVGYNDNSSISNAYATGAVSGKDTVGGLVGYNYNASISSAYATGSVNGTNTVGGLVGYNHNSTVSSAYATGAVNGTNTVGGLAGFNYNASISNAYVTGAVSGKDTVGGLAGYNYNASISNAYATSAVSGTNTVGGLVGYNYNSSIGNVYGRGAVSGTNTVGGLVGYNHNSTVSNAYATGAVSGTNSIGGLAGYNNSSIQASFYALSNASGTSLNTGLRAIGQQRGSLDALSGGKTWAQLTNLNTYSSGGWSLDATGGTSSTWRLYAGSAAPLLRSFLTPLAISLNTSDKVYDGIVSSGSTYTTSLPGATLLGSLSYSSNLANAGRYTTQAGSLTVNNHLYSTQQGYDIITQAASLTITPRPITGSITAQNKTYDGTTAAATAGTLSGVIGSDVVSLTTSGDFADKNAGTGKTVSTSGSLSGADAGNYVLLTNATTTASIAAKVITGAITAQNKTYDGTTAATTAGTLSGVIGSDVVSLATSGSFADKNAGTGKTVYTSGNLSGADADNYTLAANGATSADINRAPLSITAANVSQTAGQSSFLSGYSVTGLLPGDSVAGVTLSSAGNDAAAVPGNYLIVPSMAVGLGLGNYLISYNPGTLLVQAPSISVTSPAPAAVPEPVPVPVQVAGNVNTPPNITPTLIATQVATILASIQGTQNNISQTNADSALRLSKVKAPRSTSLSGLPGLNVVGDGVRLPEGI